MTLLVPDGFAKVIIRMTLLNKPDEVTFTYGVKNEGLLDVPYTADGVATACGGCWVGSGKPLNAADMMTGNHVEGTKVILGGAAGLQTEGQATSYTAGTGAGGNNMIQSHSWVVRKHVTPIGRRYNGRMFIPFLRTTEAAIDERGIIESANRATFNTQLAAAFDAHETAGVPMYLLHPDDVVTTAPTLINSLSANVRVGTQRRRLN